jgi:hypothetical protein
MNTRIKLRTAAQTDRILCPPARPAGSRQVNALDLRHGPAAHGAAVAGGDGGGGAAGAEGGVEARRHRRNHLGVHAHGAHRPAGAPVGGGRRCLGGRRSGGGANGGGEGGEAVGEGVECAGGAAAVGHEGVEQALKLGLPRRGREDVGEGGVAGAAGGGGGGEAAAAGLEVGAGRGEGERGVEAAVLCGQAEGVLQERGVKALQCRQLSGFSSVRFQPKWLAHKK